MYDTVIAAIESREWDREQWQHLRMAAGLKGRRTDSPRAHVAYLRRLAKRDGAVGYKHRLFHGFIAVVATTA